MAIATLALLFGLIGLAVTVWATHNGRTVYVAEELPDGHTRTTMTSSVAYDEYDLLMDAGGVYTTVLEVYPDNIDPSAERRFVPAENK